MALRDVFMRKGPMPATPWSPPGGDQEEAREQLAAPPPAPSMPPTTAALVVHPPPATPAPAPRIEARPLPQPAPLSAPSGSDLPLHAESECVRGLRARYERIRRQLDEERDRLPDLARAVATARTAAREREVQRVLEGTPESASAAEEARDLLQKAIEAETAVVHAAETLGMAHARARAELETAVEAAAKGDERRVLAALDATADQDAAALRRALDRLFLRSRLRGIHTHAQALVSTTLGLAVSGEAMVARSSELYRQIVKETQA